MDKIALLSDIHSNLPALEAVLKDIARRRIRRIVCLGDLVGKGPQPAEVVDLVRRKCEVTVQGNWDAGIALPQDNPSGVWQQERTGADRIAYLNELPFSLDLRLSGRFVRLFHASPESVYHRVNRKSDVEEKRKLFLNTEKTGMPEDGRTPDVVVYADIHLPYLTSLRIRDIDRQSGESVKRGVTLLNIGSVGLPYDGIPQPSYAILEGMSPADDGPASVAVGELTAPFSIQLVRVPYDIELAVRQAEAAELPQADRYIAELRSGRCHK